MSLRARLNLLDRSRTLGCVAVLSWLLGFVACGDGRVGLDSGVDAPIGGRGPEAGHGGSNAVGGASGEGGDGENSDLGGGAGTATGAVDGIGAEGGAGGDVSGVAGAGGEASDPDGFAGGAGDEGTAGNAGDGTAGGGEAGAGALSGDAGAIGSGGIAGTAGIDGSAGASGGAGSTGAGGQPIGGFSGGAGAGGGVGGGGGVSGAGGAGGSCPAGASGLGGALDCHDPCADSDSDLDGLNDCLDLCPHDVAKVRPGQCGCGVSDVDTDLDGVVDCVDACPTDPTRSSTGPCGVGPAHCDLTWMTVSNLYAEVGPLNILIDGYVTRIPKSNFYGGGGGLQDTYSPNLPDVTAVSQVLAALGGATKINLLLTGHSHFDHSFDTATWSFLTGAPIIGSKTTCFQTVAQGIPSQRCTEVLGGEKIVVSPGVTMRVVRWNHSGDSTTNPEQHDPVELAAVPIPDSVTGGLHAGVGEDFPNGGGGRAFLFTVDGVDGPYSWFFLNSAGYVDLDVPIVVDGVDYGAPLENLKAAMADAQLSAVDLWVGAGGDPVAQLVLPVLKPKAYLPVHWDNFFAAFLSRPGAYSDRALAATLAAQGVNLITPVQVMDKWRLDRTGVHSIPNTAIKQALDFQ